MEGIAAEVSQKLKSAIKAKLMELGAYVDEELPNYVMVMVTNRRSKAEMDRELNLFLGGNTSTFTTWLQSVWTKLEQVTVANLAIEKRKPTEKKKKVKRSTKSSSESEDDRKHKKKRKSSTSTDVSFKESKKRKSIKVESNETEIDSMSKESLEDGVFGKKARDSSSKAEVRSNIEPDSDHDTDDAHVETKKYAKGSSILDEEDFLNIKEDFETEFLSDEEVELKTKLKQFCDTKKSWKQTEKSDTTISNKKHLGTEKSLKNESEKLSDNLIDKENKQAENSVSTVKENELRTAKSAKKTILIRSRTVIRSRSRSKSLTRSSSSPLEGGSRASESVSPPASPVASNNANMIKIREKSPVLDARELINRKRALQHAAADRSAKEEKIPLKRALLSARSNDDAIRIRDGTEKENNSRENLSESKSDKQAENNFGRVIINKLEGKRNVVSGEDRFSTVSRSRKDKIDLRNIKRTVYVRNEDSEAEKSDEKAKIHKSVVNQIVKYIKDEPVASAANVTPKAVKLNRSKVTAAGSAGSTLIRKAMADAHKSLTSKEEVSKKKEVHDIKYKTRLSGGKKEESKTCLKEQMESVLTEDDSNDVEVISNDTPNAADQEDEEVICNSPKPDVERGGEGGGGEEDDEEGEEEKESEKLRSKQVQIEVEEYDPSQTIPTFVVTLTGLDPKLYPEDNMEFDEGLDMDNNPNDQQELFFSDYEETKIKPKLPEQCKYYPNCLAGDQCLYHHPTIPCKMFPNCKYGNTCLYIHPKCKFDAVCTRYDCPFLHTCARMTAPAAARHAAAPSAIGAQPCKFYYNCVNPVCPFQHPKICRYDRHCMNKNCTYQHTSLSHVNAFSKDKLKWSKPRNESEEIKSYEGNATET